MKISIAMATFNGARYLQAQLDSLAAQERLPDELVVCDDRSTDGTLAILEQFAADAPFPVRLHRNEANLGHVANFGRALSLASGDLVFPCDQDDVWLPAKLAVFERQAAAVPSAPLLVCDMLLCDEALNPGATMSQNLRRLGSAPDGNIAGCCTAVRREFLALALPLPDAGFSHDNWLHSLARAIGGRSYIPMTLQYWRRHGANESATSVSALHGISLRFRLGHVFGTALRDPVPSWRERLDRLARIRARLAERRSELDGLVGVAAARQAVHAIDAETADTGARIAMLGLDRRRRIRAVLNHWRGGGYVRQRGLASAIKDLLRPRSRATEAGS